MDQTNHYVVVKGLSKHFGASKVFEDLSFAIEEGEFITLLGPSGCGKSTLLRCLAGLETPDAGSIFVNGEDITHTKPQKRGIGMVFQSYALFPNMTAAENIAFGLKMQGLEKTKFCIVWRRPSARWNSPTTKRSTPISFRAVSVSVWRWLAPLSSSPAFCFSMNLCRHWTPASAAICVTRSARFSVRCSLRRFS